MWCPDAEHHLGFLLLLILHHDLGWPIKRCAYMDVELHKRAHLHTHLHTHVHIDVSITSHDMHAPGLKRHHMYTCTRGCMIA